MWWCLRVVGSARWAALTAWVWLSTTLGAGVVSFAHQAVASWERAERSLGLTVLLSPSATGLAAVQAAVAALPGVERAEFIAPATGGRAAWVVALHVATRLQGERLRALTAALYRFPQVEAVLPHDQVGAPVRQAASLGPGLTFLAWTLVGLLAVLTGVLASGTVGVVRLEEVRVARALGVAGAWPVLVWPAAALLAGVVGGGSSWLVVSALSPRVGGSMPGLEPSARVVPMATLFTAVAVLATWGTLRRRLSRRPEACP